MTMMGKYNGILVDAKERWDRWCRRRHIVSFLCSAALLPIDDATTQLSTTLPSRPSEDAISRVAQSTDLLKYICSIL